MPDPIKITGSVQMPDGTRFNFQADATADDPAPPAPKPVDPAELSVKVDLADGRSLLYEGKNATELGDLTIGKIKQRNLSLRLADLPLTIFFRPDRDSDRVEIGLEWGDVLDMSAKAQAIAYTATIMQAGQPIGSQAIKAHYWLARWRWQSSPRPVVHKIADLVAEGIIPPVFQFDANQKIPAAVKPYEPMGISSVTPGMGQTGERPDLGLITEDQAAYIATGAAVALQNVMAWAGAASTCAWHGRESTGEPLDFRGKHKQSAYYATHVPVPINFQPIAKDPLGQNPITIETAHWPALSYLPLLLTDDPWLLEELQFQADYGMGGTPMHLGGGKLGTEQTRGYAWQLREVLCAWVATKRAELAGPISKSLLPSSYFDACLARNADWFRTAFVENPSRKTSVLFSAVKPEQICFWQEGYLTSVLYLASMVDPDRWEAAFQWKIKSTLARTNGKSGWPHTRPSDYYTGFSSDAAADPDGKTRLSMKDGTRQVVAVKNGVLATDAIDPATGKPYVIDDSVGWVDPDGKIKGPVVGSWGELATRASKTETPDGRIDQSEYQFYYLIERGLLGLAAQKRVADAADPAAWMNGQVKGRNWVVPWRWSF